MSLRAMRLLCHTYLSTLLLTVTSIVAQPLPPLYVHAPSAIKTHLNPFTHVHTPSSQSAMYFPHKVTVSQQCSPESHTTQCWHWIPRTQQGQHTIPYGDSIHHIPRVSLSHTLTAASKTFQIEMHTFSSDTIFPFSSFLHMTWDHCRLCLFNSPVDVTLLCLLWATFPNCV